MKKKLLRIFSSVLCLCMLTTACGGGTEDAGNGDDGGEAKDTLTIWQTRTLSTEAAPMIL